MNSYLSKKELLEKLDAISELHSKAVLVRDKMSEYEPEDHYSREIIVPDFPGNYENEDDRDYFKESIDHEDEDAEELIGEFYDSRYRPKKPEEPKTKKFEYVTSISSDSEKEKLGCFSKIAAGISIFFLLGALLNIGDSDLLFVMPIMFTIVVIGALAFVVFKIKLKSLNDTEAKKEADARVEYNREVERIKLEYNEKLKQYESDYAAYQLKRDEFLKEYVSWRDIYLKSVEEESEITEKLEEDRIAQVEKMKAEELVPIFEELAKINDVISFDYLPAIDDIIGLIKSGRADNVKEAINLYENIIYREKQLQLEREKEEQRRYEEECRRQDEERHYREQLNFQKEQERQRAYEAQQQLRMQEQQHKEQMAFQEKQEKQRAYESARQLKMQEQQHKEQMRVEEQRLKQQEDASRASRQKRCAWCAHYPSCTLSYGEGAYNCTGFRPR